MTRKPCSTFRPRTCLGLLLAVTAMVTTPVGADDGDDGIVIRVRPSLAEAAEEAEKTVVQEAAKARRRLAAPTHWIGVHAVPVDAALKSHLRIKEDRLIVRQVIKNSPAETAGVQVHDVLLKYADTSIATVDELIKAIDQSPGKPNATLELIRGGKKMSLEVTAEKRPAKQIVLFADQPTLEEFELQDAGGAIRKWIEYRSAGGGDGPVHFQIVGPGIVDRRIDVNKLHVTPQGNKLPKNLSIQINKTGDAPARIKVTRDGDTWEVTEDKLNELPADIRAHVLRGRQGVVVGLDDSAVRLKALQVHPPQARKTQFFRRQTESDVDVQQLRKDVDQLKAAVKKLQGARSRKNKQED